MMTPSSCSLAQRPKSSCQFTGKERDAETGLDYFGARYYSGAQGRFSSPDPITILPERLLDPQQLNLYAYVRNNPLKLIDPTGMKIDAKKCDENKECASWKSKLLSSEEGLALWGKLDADQSLLVTIEWDTEASSSEVDDYKWDSEGNLTEATLTLAKKSGDPNNVMDDKLNPLGSNITDSDERKVYVFGHELAHVEDADSGPGIQRWSKARSVVKGANEAFGYKALSKEPVKSVNSIMQTEHQAAESKADQRGYGIVESNRKGKEDKR
jgi:RHS repeat-associated protein